MTQKRSGPRRDLKWNVNIIGDEGTLIGQCRTSNVSARGAKLILEEAIEVPDRFFISFSLDGKVKRGCKVAWRNGNEIGVLFAASR
jgi:hypothetical protein